MIDVFTLKRISPDCPFKSNQRRVKIVILIPRCAIYLRGMLIEYPDEIETEFENTFVCLSVAQMGSNREKNRRSKIS